MSGLETLLTSFFVEVVIFGLGIVVTLVGAIYKLITNRINDAEGRLTTIENRLDTVFSWAFGTDADCTDRGVSGDLENVTNSLSELIDRVDELEAQECDELRDEFEQLVDALHYDDSIDFDRDDLN
jgi:hypothetical protein